MSITESSIGYEIDANGSPIINEEGLFKLKRFHKKTYFNIAD